MMLESPEFSQLQARLVGALRDFPEARIAVLAEFERLEVASGDGALPSAVPRLIQQGCAACRSRNRRIRISPVTLPPRLNPTGACSRPEQLPPKDFLAWSIWLFLAGRGSGKNWADSHYVHELAATGAVMRVALIGATADATRYTMVEGTAGILAAAGARDRPVFEASKGQLTWPSGCIARLYSADSPELLRGPEFDLAWCDELASWRRAQETWDNLNFCMRGGKHPHIIISTTPKPTKLIKNLVAREGVDGIVISRSSTYDNRVNLPPSFFAQLVRKYEGTRVGRQELNAELLLDTPGSLWTVENLERTRVRQAPPMQRIVVAIDPTGRGSEDADECGIIVAGLGQNGEGYVLADESGRMTPTEWARRAIDAYRRFKADKIVAEVNFGALMIAGTIAAVDPNVPLKSIASFRGKILRAEPISTLFEQGRCHLVGSFPASRTKQHRSPVTGNAAVMAVRIELMRSCLR